MEKPNSRNKQNKKLSRQVKGSAMLETLAGLMVLVPIVLLLVDVVALVVAQSINDDLAKQAARYAAQQTLITQNDGITPNTSAMQTAAQTLATQYLSSTCWASATSGLVYPGNNGDPFLQNFACNFNSNPPTVQVTTQIQCNLPVQLPFIGTLSTSFQAQATEPIVGLQPVPQS
jgi:Flp pilus assembly protein TadG